MPMFQNTFGDILKKFRGSPSVLSQIPPGAVGLWLMGDFVAGNATQRPYVPNRLDRTAPRRGLGPPNSRNFLNTQFFTKGASPIITDANAIGPDGLTNASTLTNAGNNWYVSLVGVAAASYLPTGPNGVGINVRYRGTSGTSPNFKLGNLVGSQTSIFTAPSTWTGSRFFMPFTVGATASILFGSPDGTSTADFEFQNFDVFPGSVDLGPDPISSNIYFQKTTATAPAPTYASGLLDLSNGSNAGHFQFQSLMAMGAFTVSWTGMQVAAPFSSSYIPVVANMSPVAGFNKFAVGPVMANAPSAYLNNVLLNSSVNLDLFGLDSVGRNLSNITMTYDGTTFCAYVNGYRLINTPASVSNYSTADFYFNTLNQTFWSGMKYAAVSQFPYALNKLQVLQLSNVLNAYAVSQGCSLEPFRPVAFEGDSIMHGAGSTGFGNSHAQLTELACVPIIRAGNSGVPGSVLAGINARLPALLAAIPADKRGVKYVLNVAIGTNDLAVAQDQTSLFMSGLQSYYVAARANGAGFDIINGYTLTSRNDTADGAGGANYDTYRAVFHTAMRAGGAMRPYFDNLIDIAANPNIGANGQAAFTTNFASDHIHPNNPGHLIYSGIETPVINVCWGY